MQIETSGLPRRRDRPAEPVRIAESKRSHSPHRGRLRVQRGASLLRGGGNRVHILTGRQLQREPFPFSSFLTLRPIVLREENANRAGAHRYREHLAVPLVFTIDDEAKSITVPLATSCDVTRSQGRFEALGHEWRMLRNRGGCHD